MIFAIQFDGDFDNLAVTTGVANTEIRLSKNQIQNQIL